MANKKKTSKSTAKKEKELEEMVEKLEKNVKKIESEKELEEKIKDKRQAIKEDLQNQLISQNKFGKHFDDMIEDYLYFVELKETLQHDIDLNGIRYKTTGGNGFTTFKPNESCERLIKTNAQMLKILQDLDLKTPDDGPKEGEGDDLL
ncbi:MAG: hypothetical protein IJV31_10555 [Clostridia bacterium]|nr:hypothetical protein [Clostridia bacterium]